MSSITIDPGNSINANCVGWWPMDEGSGTTVADVSGNGLDGSLVGSPSWADGGVVFDGSDDEMVVTHDAALAITGNMTMMAWVKYASYDWHMLFVKANSGTAGPYTAYVNAVRGTIEFHRGNGTLSDYVESTDPGPTDEWYFVAVTMSGTTVTHYLNGASNGSGTLSTTIGDSGTDLRFGRRTDGFYLTGSAKNIRLFDRALSGAEIASLYSDPFFGQLAPTADPPTPATAPLSSDRLYNRSLTRIFRRGETR